jgi:hypothetical protein
MNRTKKLAAAIVAALGLGIGAGAALAHEGGRMGMGAHGTGAGQGGMGHGMHDGTGAAMHGGMGQGMQGGMGHGMHGGMGTGPKHGAMDHGAGRGDGAAQSLMSPEERNAFRERMRNATTPEERQKLALENRTEMQKRAQEKGITLPEPRGPRAGSHHPGAPAATPAR